MNFFWVALLHSTTSFCFSRNYLLIIEWCCSGSILMQLFLTKSSKGLTLKNLSLAWRNLCKVLYLFNVIVEAMGSYLNSLDQYILYWLIFTIVIVIWVPKSVSISWRVVSIDLPVCCVLYRFVWYSRWSQILSSQNFSNTGVMSSLLHFLEDY